MALINSSLGWILLVVLVVVHVLAFVRHLSSYGLNAQVFWLYRACTERSIERGPPISRSMYGAFLTCAGANL